MPHEHLGALTTHLAHWLHRLMPPGPRLETLAGGLEPAFGDRRDPVTAETCRELELHCQRTARHLELHFDPDGTAPPDEHAPGWPPPDPAAVRRRAGGVTGVRRLDDGTCEIRIDSLEPVSFALPYLQAAFDLAREASSLVLDLRSNGGGDPATVAVIAGRLLGETTRPLSEVVYRDRRRQWWPSVTGEVLTQDATVLVSGRTYSSAEALAYHLQARGRVTVIGERTPGAADHVTPIRLTPRVLGLLPEATVVDAVTGTNWEQTGVRAGP
ncbi:S41 family peptidase [Actinoplanes sp. NPDC000266]